MALIVGSVPSNKNIIACYLNDRQEHVAIITESNVARNELPNIGMEGYSLANHFYRKEALIKGGGGGGIIILIYDCAPYTKGYDLEGEAKGEMEHCSTTVYPNNNYEQKLVITGAF